MRDPELELYLMLISTAGELRVFVMVLYEITVPSAIVAIIAFPFDDLVIAPPSDIIEKKFRSTFVGKGT